MTFDADQSVGAYDAKTRFSELLEKVEAGEEITITRHGHPVARLVPFQRKPNAIERAEAIATIRELRANVSLGGLTIRDLINEGRR